ncbi:MAG: hypothetical protein JJT96_04415 [Opitutales bacterium]|nr:hypothetical protein [Opitutales bacterium]
MRRTPVFLCSFALFIWMPMGWGDALPVAVDRVIEPAPSRTPASQPAPSASVRRAGDQPAAPQARWTAPTARVIDETPAPPARWEGVPRFVEPPVSAATDSRVPVEIAQKWSPGGARAPDVHPRWGTHNRARLLDDRPVVRMPFREEAVGIALEELSMQDFNRYVFRRNHSVEPGAVPRQRAGRSER